MSLDEISFALQNPKSEVERMGAWGALKLYLTEHPLDQQASYLLDKYCVLDRDWTKELVS